MGKLYQKQFNKERAYFCLMSQRDTVHHGGVGMETAGESMAIRAGCKEVIFYPNAENRGRG